MHIMRGEAHTVKARREVLIRVARLARNGTLVKDIDDIPFDMLPKGAEIRRCCIHRARAVVRQRILAAMGFSIDDDDGRTRLSVYAERALAMTEVPDTVLTVADEGCSGCVSVRYLITDACRGCANRPCALSCPKNAIVFIDGKAKIDKQRCINCGRCLKACPFQAVIDMPVPCETACPVGAIVKDGEGKATIDQERCIVCGRCQIACPYGAVLERSQLLNVTSLLRDQKKRLVALVAPSAIGQFPGSYGQFRAALKATGFADVYDVAIGADETAAHEAAEYRTRVVDGGESFMTTSCCFAYKELVDKHIPALAPFVSETPTPLAYAAAAVKKNDPDAVTVFVGPCAAKRREALKNKDIDRVLTFEEVGALIVAADVNVLSCQEDVSEREATAGGKGFPVTGGVASAVCECLSGDHEVERVFVDGITKKNVGVLRAYAAKKQCGGTLLEVMACDGGCMGGPGVVADPAAAAQKLKAYLGRKE